MPVWSRDGKELYYLTRNQLMAVELKPGVELVVGARKLLFQARFTIGVLAQYDVAPNGQGFVVSAEPEPSSRLAVITDFLAGMKR
jgi:hypothetical protein